MVSNATTYLFNYVTQHDQNAILVEQREYLSCIFYYLCFEMYVPGLMVRCLTIYFIKKIVFG